jgi:hypothetical protein
MFLGRTIYIIGSLQLAACREAYPSEVVTQEEDADPVRRRHAGGLALEHYPRPRGALSLRGSPMKSREARRQEARALMMWAIIAVAVLVLFYLLIGGSPRAQIARLGPPVAPDPQLTPGAPGP